MFDHTRKNVLLQLRRKLFGYACVLCQDTPSAEDLYQDTLLRAMSARTAPDSQAAYCVWVFRIMRNLWIDGLRASGRLPEFDDATEIDDIAEGGGDDVVVNALAVRQAFSALSKAHRDILALVDICGFSYAEAADLLQVPPGTIMSRVSRARNALTRKMQEEVNVISLPLRRPLRILGEKE